MAHELDMSNNRANFAYAKDIKGAVWHGLGTDLEDNATIEQWTEAAGFGWDAVKQRVKYDLPDGTQGEFQGQSVVYRSDTKAALGVVADSYKIVQPRDVLEFFRDLVSFDNMKLKSAGMIFGGRKFWAMADTGRAFDATNNDVVNGNLLLTTSLDGSTATVAMTTSIRVVCNNTLRMAMAEGQTRARVTHRQTFDAKALKEQMGLYDQSWETFRNNVKDLTKVRVDDIKAREFIANLLAIPGREEQPYTVEKNTDAIFQLYKDGLGNQGRNVWELVNGVTQFVDHGGFGRLADNVFESSQFGDGMKLKSKAFESALELV